MVAARRFGADVAYGGSLGVGVFAEIARAALEAEGVHVLTRRRANLDQGVCVVLVDASGERSFVSHHGAERELEFAELARTPVSNHEWILLSGYSLYHPRSAEPMARWLGELPLGPRFLFDPGPVAAKISEPLLAIARKRADWVSANRREAEALTGLADPSAAARALATGRAGALVRVGDEGCWLSLGGRAAQHIDGFTVSAIDTTGAGDVHVGAFIAASLRGHDPREAAVMANAAAAISATRRGGAAAPDLAEVLEFLVARGVGLASPRQSSDPRVQYKEA
jgi:sugar/nucleoside kinase (ribokinase family)